MGMLVKFFWFDTRFLRRECCSKQSFYPTIKVSLIYIIIIVGAETPQRDFYLPYVYYPI